MSVLTKLIYEEILVYQDKLTLEMISDLNIMNNENINDNNLFQNNTRNYVIRNLDNYQNLIKIKKNKNLVTEKWNCNVDEKCLICFEIVTKEHDIYNLKCGTSLQQHIYHKICFERWNKNSCPYCRTEIK